ncbi:hypothetical protein H310_03057 [Aphanomyces invadans]|uniref:CFA20 domain-containing protein n=1 Tax=Aphanomyces invadans TaxID=157072 RepID=A0A024UM85_9STRA|nr:hypothetical protein H310_03057 [Aphanomyces invadans]ETW06947.1 hypothetical protein H310_03057 [Aphanomyces invadans]|eukprot:XP_008865022.1 hypothetical protein H310_03057 [Aphanomyces invadans]
MFQGGDSVELLAAGGKNPAAPWKLTGKVRREYDKLSKVFLFTMEGSALATKMALPKDSTKSLGLTQRYLVLQTAIPAAAAISVEVGVTDANGTRRRIVMSSAFRGAVVHQLHAQVPLQQVTRDTWLNWCFDVAALVDGSFAKTLRTLDSISLSGTCKLRRVFTMKEPPIPSDHPFDFVGGVDIPRAFAIPGAITEYFAAKTVAPPPSASLPTHFPDNSHREKAKTPRPTSSTRSARVAAAAGGKPLSADSTKKTLGAPSSASSSRSTSSRGARRAPPHTETREPASALPSAPSSVRPSSAHNSHIQGRRRIQPVTVAPPPLSSMFRFAFTEAPGPSDSPEVQSISGKNRDNALDTTRRFDSKFRSWEDDKSPVKPPTHTEAPRLSRPTTAIASDAVEPVVDAVPTSRSNAELTAKELAKALALDESPFFRDDLPSPVAVPAAMEWMDEEDSRGVSNEDSAPPSILDGRPDNQTPDSIPEPTSTTPEVKNQRIDVGAAKSVASLFQWAPQSLLQPVGQPQLTAALDPPFAPCMEDEEGPLTSNGIAKVAHHSEPQDDTEQVRVKEEVSHPLGTKGRWMDQNNSEDDDDELSFDMTKDLQAQSFDFTDVLEESLPSMVQMNCSPVARRPPPAKTTHSHSPPTARSVVDPRIQSLLESTDWSQPPPMDLVYDPILDCYHDPQSNKYYQWQQ